MNENSLISAREVVRKLRNRLRHAVLGRDEVIELILVALLADGHVLLEDYPGSGKTTLAKTLGTSIEDDLPDDDIPDFSRIQFTPDLLPSDITGANVFDPDTKSVTFRRGPIFAYVVLGDEINRTSPRVQAATLEAMAEKQVTVDNVSHHLNELFFFIATQNPLDLAGTYPLPSAQLDRFLFRIHMDFIDRESEIEVLNSEFARSEKGLEKLPKISRGEVVSARNSAKEGVFIHPRINECLVDIARALRADPEVVQGVSTRSLILMRHALRATALSKERDFVTAEDIQFVAPHVFCHRLLLETGSRPAEAIVEDCCRQPLDALSKVGLNR